MNVDAKTKLKLNTAHAKSQLRDVRRMNRHASRQQKAKHRGKTIGVGAGFAAVFNAIGRITHAEGDRDPWTEATLHPKAVAEAAIAAKVGHWPSAQQQARQETRSAWALDVGARGGKIPAAMWPWYQQRLAMHDEEAKGMNIVKQDPQYRYANMGELLAQLSNGYMRLIGRSIDNIFGERD